MLILFYSTMILAEVENRKSTYSKISVTMRWSKWLCTRCFLHNRKILVTGGTGFVGQHLIKALQSDGHQVGLNAPC